MPRSIPKIGTVSRSSMHALLSAKTLEANEVDVVVRFISDGQPHRAIPLTGAMCTAAAAKLCGSIVHARLAEQPVAKGMVTIAHPSGRRHGQRDTQARQRVRVPNCQTHHGRRCLLERAKHPSIQPHQIVALFEKVSPPSITTEMDVN